MGEGNGLIPHKIVTFLGPYRVPDSENYFLYLKSQTSQNMSIREPKQLQHVWWSNNNSSATIPSFT